MNELCKQCGGKVHYPRRCRSLLEMREANGLPEVCPFGLPIKARPTEPRKAVHRTAECLWAVRLSCCKVQCTHEEGLGLTFVSAHCQPGRCRYYKAVEETAWAAQ